MSHNGAAPTRHTVTVVSLVEEWTSLKSLLQDSSGEGDNHRPAFSCLGSNQVCDLTVHGHSISLHYADLKEDMTEEVIGSAMESCFKSCTDGCSVFLLLIQGGQYTKRERRLVEILQSHFGAEALKYLVILSLEDGKVVDALDDALMELINVCDGRYCRITSSAAAHKMRALLEMIDFTLAESGARGYTEAMLVQARTRSTEDTAMTMLRQKVREAEEREQAFSQLVQRHEERRSREMEALRAKHVEERKKEAAEKKQHETKREGLEEAVTSHRAVVQLQMSDAEGDKAKKMSVVLLGLSGSGKSSALNAILERACNQYSAYNESGCERLQSTLVCERKEVSAAGKRLVLVDTPELWDEDGAEDPELLKDCLALSLPGPHVFLLVLQVGRFTQGECEMLGHLQRMFGREVVEHAIVLFVRFDSNHHRPQRINDYVSGAHSALQDLLRKCGSRYYELNVTESHNALGYPQVKELLAGMNKLVASHGGRSYAVRRFSVQELQERRKVIEEGGEEVQEGNYLLREA